MKRTAFLLSLLCFLCLAGCKTNKNSSAAEASGQAAVSAETPEPEDLDVLYGADLLKPGTPAPEFSLGDLGGKKVSLSDFRGKTVVLDFWATWCPDCRAEIPALKAMYAAADPSKVTFVSVSYDRDIETLRKYVAENGMPWVQLFDPAGKKDSGIGADYHVKWIPSMYVIGPDGKVVLSTVVASKVAAFLDGK